MAHIPAVPAPASPPAPRARRGLLAGAAVLALLAGPASAAPQPQAGGRAGMPPEQPDAPALAPSPGPAPTVNPPPALAPDTGAGEAASGPGDQADAGDDDAEPVGSGAFGAFLGGQFALSRDDPSDAADLLLRALRADPDNATLQQQTFLACLLAGRDEAVPLAAQLHDTSAALLLLGDTKARDGQWHDAAALYGALAPQPLTDIIRPLLVAWAQQGAGDTDAALGTLAPLMRERHAQGIYALHAAMIADQAGRAEEAVRLFADAEAGFTGTNLRLAQIIASFEARHGDMAAARATIEALVARSPDLAMSGPGLLAAVGQPVISTPAEGIAEVYLAMAASLRQQNADAFAQVLLRLALRLRPDLTAAKLLMSDILLASHRAEEGLALLRGVPDGDPLHAVVALRIAQFEGALDEDAVAERALRALAAQYPDQPEPLEQLGAQLVRQKRFGEAVVAYDAAMARIAHPGDADWALFFDRGVALDRAHQWARAEDDLQRALRMAPDQAVVENYLGYSWADQNRNLAKARELLQRAVAAKPEDGEVVDSLGWVMLRQGDVAGAVRRLERATELSPDDATINSHLGDAYWAAGRRREAADQWRRALVFKPEPDEVAPIEAKLRRAEAELPGARAAGGGAGGAAGGAASRGAVFGHAAPAGGAAGAAQGAPDAASSPGGSAGAAVPAPAADGVAGRKAPAVAAPRSGPGSEGDAGSSGGAAPGPGEGSAVPGAMAPPAQGR